MCVWLPRSPGVAGSLADVVSRHTQSIWRGLSAALLVLQVCSGAGSTCNSLAEGTRFGSQVPGVFREAGPALRAHTQTLFRVARAGLGGYW